ncbi:MAG: dihydrodipicolinate synthase family protein [Armatimonadota bacterium]|nr:dihydrodipicolinate synthase family protein [Armatimonadota bacterium]MDR7587005.1 dihydrodipicolinate synthase family protein [Armatimonadota bacterium]MDR7612396.1 dihydrodipicolinate synthase family protein [Armatimonadota bacterium]
MALAPERVRGIVVPMITPLEDDGVTVSERGVEALVEFLVGQGVHAIFVAGTTGEAAALTDTQWARLVAETHRALRGRLPLLAGVLGPTTAHAAARARQAADLGADAVVATAPYYYPPDPDELLRHFRAVLEATTLPVLLYNIPQTTKVDLPLAVCRELAADSRVIGLKDSWGDVTRFRRWTAVLRGGGRDFRMLLGTDLLTDVAVLVGAQGTVPSLGNIAGRHLVAVFDAAAAGDWTSAARLQATVADLTRVYDTGVGGPQSGIIAGLKGALTLLGIPAGPPAPPVRPVDRTGMQRVEAVLREAGLLE